MDRDEYNRKQREYRANNNNVVTRRYEKTKNGFLMRLYRNMKSRVEGIQKTKHHLYKGKYLIDKDSFYDWALNSDKFHELWDAWEESGYQRKLTPSVDRINSQLGYTKKNMEWVTFSENCRRGGLSKKR